MDRIVNPRVEYRREPLAVADPNPRFSWEVESARRAVVQEGYRILVALDGNGTVLWDSGAIRSRETAGIPYAGDPLPAGGRLTWSIEAILSDEPAPVRAASWFETAPEPTLWDQAGWITLRRTHYQNDDNRPAPLLRTVVSGDRVARARLHVTAGGLVRVSVDGEPLAPGALVPGWTDYRLRVPFHSFDVTRFFDGTPVTIAAELADGWYSGGVGPYHLRRHWGKHPVLKAILVIDDFDGARRVTATDETWQAAFGAVRASDLLQGEAVDARLDRRDWATGGGEWTPATIEKGPDGVLAPAGMAPAAPIAELPAAAVTETLPGSILVDFGQNFAGHVRMRLRGAPGTIVRVRHGEVLTPDGVLYVDNLRGARATDTVILTGSGVEDFEPAFTYHGFRYAEITGLAGPDSLVEVTGIPVSSIAEMATTLETGSALVNRLQHNIQWSMFSNYIDVPTDCPSRDERLGWTGDVQVFAPASLANADLAAFYTKWMSDVEDAQQDDGSVPDIAPGVIFDWTAQGSAGWGDVCTALPHAMHESYGDRRMLERGLAVGGRWVDYVRRRTTDLIWREDRNIDYGDWLAPEKTPNELTATAYFANSVRLVAEFARLLGDERVARDHQELFEDVARAFRGAFVDADGTIPVGTQSAYVFALAFGLLEPGQRETAAGALAAAVEETGQLATGFLGAASLLPVLTEAGRSDLAYNLLLAEAYPSWGYEIAHGATTIWERWDGWRDEVGFQNPLMNSFNHFAFGAVGAWLVASLAGIAPAEPGYSRVRVAPQIDRRIGFSRATHRSLRGPIAVAWAVDRDQLEVEVEFPANVGGLIRLPLTGATESGGALRRAAGIVSWSEDAGGTSIEVGSGRYRFSGTVLLL